MSEDELRQRADHAGRARHATRWRGATHRRRGRAAPPPDRDRRSPPPRWPRWSASVPRSPRSTDGGDRIDEPAADVGRWSTDRDVASGAADVRDVRVDRQGDAGLRRQRRAPLPARTRTASAGEATRQFRDGAAYDPDTDSWRRIADTPIEFGVAQAELVGDEVVVVAQPAGQYDESQTWTYDLAGDRWRRGADAPAYAIAPGRGRRPGGDARSRAGRPAGSTTRPTTGGPRCRPTRSATRSTGRWSSTAATCCCWRCRPRAVTSGPTCSPGSTSTPMEWTTLPQTPVGMGVSVWFWWKDQLINPSSGIGGGVWDPATDELARRAAAVATRTPPSAPARCRSCPRPAAGSATTRRWCRSTPTG